MGRSAFQAQKRKLGLLKDDDMSKLADMASAKEQDFEEGKVTEVPTQTGKNKGVLAPNALQTCKLDGRKFHFVYIFFLFFFFPFNCF